MCFAESAISFSSSIYCKSNLEILCAFKLSLYLCICCKQLKCWIRLLTVV